MSCGCDAIEHMGSIGRAMRWTEWVEIVPDQATAHASGDVISQELSFTCVANAKGGTARIEEVVVVETGDATHLPQKPEMDLVIYAAPSAPADKNVAWEPPVDLTTIIAVIEITEFAWHDIDAENARAYVPAAIEIKAPDGSTTVYGVLVARDVPAWTDNSIQKLHLQLRINRD